MNRICICVLLSFLTAYSAFGQDRELSEASAKLAQQISQSGKKTIAIANLTNAQSYGSQFSDYVVDELSTLLAGAGKGFDVVTRSRLTQIIDERRLKFSNNFDAAAFQQLGKFAGADAIIAGNYRVLGSVVTLNLQILDISRGTVIAGVICNIPKTNDVEEILGKPRESSTPEHSEAQQGKPPDPSLVQLPPVESFRPTETISLAESYINNAVTVSAYKCKISSTTIVCYLLIVRRIDGNQEYHASVGNVRFIDNLNIEHQEVRSYYVNGRGQSQKSVNLGRGDTAWIAHEFAGPSSQITSARIIYPSQNVQLHIRVE